MSILLIGILIFVLTFFIIELSFFTVRIIRYPDRSEIRKRLKQSLADESAGSNQNIIKNQVLSEIPVVNLLLSHIPRIKRMQLYMKQANVSYSLSTLLLLSAVLGLSVYLLFYLFTLNIPQSLLLAIAVSSIPFLHVRSKRQKRIMKFEKQLPDGLGLIARALRAGHAFSSGMKIASEEMEDPLGPEFGDTLDEINFGLSVAEALKNLTRRVDCPDIKFFVVSVILQRETGGNLAEIIENLAHIIRERFKFRRKVRVLSAEGRLSGFILVLLPFFLSGVLFLVSPTFIVPLFLDPIGHVMIAIGCVMMFIGVLIIKRIITVDV